MSRVAHTVLDSETGYAVVIRAGRHQLTTVDCNRRYIGGTWPFRPTLTRAAVRLPSGWRCVTANTLAPGLSSPRSVGVKDTITAFSGTSTFFSPPLYRSEEHTSEL